MVLTGMWSRGWTAVSLKYSVSAIKTFRWCYMERHNCLMIFCFLIRGAFFSIFGALVAIIGTSDLILGSLSKVLGTFRNREFKIRRLRTTTTNKHATAHDQNHVTVHYSRVVLRLRWVVELFRVVATTENILLVVCRLGNSRISFLRKKVFNSPASSERRAKYVSCV